MATRKNLAFLQRQLRESITFLGACATVVGLVCLHQLTLLLFLIMVTLIAVMLREIVGQIPLPKKWAVVMQIVVVVCVLSFFWLDYSASPASAFFFEKAQAFFIKTFQNSGGGSGGGNDTTTKAIDLVFNVLRALFLLYLAVALIGVLNSVRRDEDWQVLARTPLVVVVAVTIADVLTGLILPP